MESKKNISSIRITPPKADCRNTAGRFLSNLTQDRTNLEQCTRKRYHTVNLTSESNRPMTAPPVSKVKETDSIWCVWNVIKQSELGDSNAAVTNATLTMNYRQHFGLDNQRSQQLYQMPPMIPQSSGKLVLLRWKRINWYFSNQRQISQKSNWLSGVQSRKPIPMIAMAINGQKQCHSHTTTTYNITIPPAPIREDNQRQGQQTNIIYDLAQGNVLTNRSNGLPPRHLW